MKLPPERMQDIKAHLHEKGLENLADEVFGHIAAQEDEITRLNQYYEEFLIPEMEKGTWTSRAGRISLGDRVAYTREWMDKTGQHTGARTTDRGKVTGLKLEDEGIKATVMWDGATIPATMPITVLK